MRPRDAMSWKATWAGTPERDEFSAWGLEFKAGKAVTVNDPTVAAMLREHPEFKVTGPEIGAGQVSPGGAAEAPEISPLDRFVTAYEGLPEADRDDVLEAAGLVRMPEDNKAAFRVVYESMTPAERAEILAEISKDADQGGTGAAGAATVRGGDGGAGEPGADADGGADGDKRAAKRGRKPDGGGE